MSLSTDGESALWRDEVVAKARESWHEWIAPVLQRQYRDRLRQTLHPPPNAVHIDLRRGTHGWGWYACDQREDEVWFRWGAARAGVEVRVDTSRPLRLRFEASSMFGPEGVLTFGCSVNGQRLTLSGVRRADVNWGVFEAEVPSEALDGADGLLTFVFETPRPVRPCDVSEGSRDDRVVGIALAWIEVAPPDATTAVLQHCPSPPRQVVFLHIPKSAGTTVRQMLSLRFDRLRSLDLNVASRQQLYDLNEHLKPEDLAPFDHIAGHFRYDLVGLRTPNAIKLTFLREPIERCLSLFRFLKDLGSRNKLDEPARNELMQRITLDEFIDSNDELVQHMRDNPQVKFLGDLSTPEQRPPDEMIRLAKERLAAMPFFGIVERMPESLVMMCQVLELEMPEEVPSINRAKRRPLRDQLSPSQLARIEHTNRYDIAFYQFALELFETRWQAQLESIALETWRDWFGAQADSE